MKVDGRCHCGQTTFEAEVDPATVTICHCSDCQMLTGSAFRANIRTPAASFVLKGPAPSAYIKTADSGNRRLHAFCGHCGTPLYATEPENPQAYSLRIGTLRQRHELLPARQIWRQSALGWVDRLGELPQHARG